MKREERRHQANQIRKNKRQEAIALKRALGGNTAPFLTCIIPLHQSIDSLSVISILENCDEQAVVTKTSSIIHIAQPRSKHRFSFIIPPHGKLSELQILDYLKVCDSTIFLVSANTYDDPIDKWGRKILGMATAQGIPTPIVTLMDLESISPKKRMQVKMNIQKLINSLLPNERIMTLDSNSDGLNMFRRIGGQKRNALPNKQRRPHFYAEKTEYLNESQVLKVTGFLRGQSLNVNGLVHIPGLGDFQMCQIDAPPDPYKLDKRNEMVETRVIARVDHNKQVSLIKENIPLEMDADQPDISNEEIAAAQLETKNARLVKAVPKEIGDYQAAWISDREEELESENSDLTDTDDERNEDFMSCDSEENYDKITSNTIDTDDLNDEMSTITEAPIIDEVYDKSMDLDEEKRTLQTIIAAQEEKKYPDEIDTPQDVAARTRFQKYRALESFRTSPWDKKENLPLEYASIYQFRNFEKTKKRVLKESKNLDGAQPGMYITVYIAGVDYQGWTTYQSANNYVIIYGLLPYENQMSCLNAVVTRVSDSEIPIKSKERLIVQCGYRRFIINPIFSQHTNGDKHKYERYFRPGETVVATFFAPIQFPPAPILFFMENPNSSLSLVASGRLISCNPDRIILKRVVLSGHPLKIHRKTATIRYMFFNKDDVNYFKPCRLRTKCGRQGHIKESLGTHGHMKCIFDGQLKSFDTVLLHLYKRVFPKWTYEDCIVHSTTKESTKTDVEMK